MPEIGVAEELPGLEAQPPAEAQSAPLPTASADLPQSNADLTTLDLGQAAAAAKPGEREALLQAHERLDASGKDKESPEAGLRALFEGSAGRGRLDAAAPALSADSEPTDLQKTIQAMGWCLEDRRSYLSGKSDYVANLDDRLRSIEKEERVPFAFAYGAGAMTIGTPGFDKALIVEIRQTVAHLAGNAPNKRTLKAEVNKLAAAIKLAGREPSDESALQAVRQALADARRFENPSGPRPAERRLAAPENSGLSDAIWRLGRHLEKAPAFLATKRGYGSRLEVRLQYIQEHGGVLLWYWDVPGVGRFDDHATAPGLTKELRADIRGAVSRLIEAAPDKKTLRAGVTRLAQEIKQAAFQPTDGEVIAAVRSALEGARTQAKTEQPSPDRSMTPYRSWANVVEWDAKRFHESRATLITASKARRIMDESAREAAAEAIRYVSALLDDPVHGKEIARDLSLRRVIDRLAYNFGKMYADQDLGGLSQELARKADSVFPLDGRFDAGLEYSSTMGFVFKMVLAPIAVIVAAMTISAHVGRAHPLVTAFSVFGVLVIGMILLIAYARRLSDKNHDIRSSLIHHRVNPELLRQNRPADPDFVKAMEEVERETVPIEQKIDQIEPAAKVRVASEDEGEPEPDESEEATREKRARR